MYRISVQDVTVPENKANKSSTSLPKYIVCRLLDALSAVSFQDHYGIPGYAFYENRSLAHNRAALIESNRCHMEFVKWAILRLIRVIKPSELVVYTIKREIAVLKIGSYLVTPLLFSGIRVLNSDEEFEVLRMLIIDAYAKRSLMERTRYNIEINLNGISRTVSVGTAQQAEGTGKFIKLIKYTGTEFIKLYNDDIEIKSCEEADNDIYSTPPTELCTKIIEYVEGGFKENKKLIEAFDNFKSALLKDDVMTCIVVREFQAKLLDYGCLSRCVVDQTLFKDLDTLVDLIDLHIFKNFDKDDPTTCKAETCAELKVLMDSDMVGRILSRLEFYKRIF